LKPSIQEFSDFTSCRRSSGDIKGKRWGGKKIEKGKYGYENEFRNVKEIFKRPILKKFQAGRRDNGGALGEKKPLEEFDREISCGIEKKGICPKDMEWKAVGIKKTLGRGRSVGNEEDRGGSQKGVQLTWGPLWGKNLRKKGFSESTRTLGGRGLESLEA